MGDAVTTHRVVLDSTDPSEVTTASAVVARDPALSRVDDVSVAVRRDGSSTAGLSTDGPLTDEAVDTWGGGPGHRPSSDRGALRRAGLSIAVDGTVDLSVDLALDDAPARADLTTRRYGTTLWPTLRAQLDLVADGPPGSHFDADYDDPLPGSDVTGTDPFLDVTTPATTGRDRLGRTWNAEAADYLRSGG